MATRQPPPPAAAGGLLARLTGVDFCGLKRGGKNQHAVPRAWLMEGVAFGGVGLSAVLAGVGVIGLVGFDSTLAKLGSGILLGGTLLTEIAAARLPVHAQRRFAEGGWLKGGSVVLGFAALTAWNVIAGHFGMAAIDGAAVADVRAPLERQAAITDAARETAEDALGAFDEAAQRDQEAMGLALRGAFESGYVTAAARGAREDAAARNVRREVLAAVVAAKRAEDRAAERALEAAPRPRDDRELWGFALVLELLKGALVWFATASERKNVLQCNTKRGAIISAPSLEALKIIDPRTASASERRALKTYCASTLATLRHMEAARA